MRSKNRVGAAVALMLVAAAVAPATGGADVDSSKPWIVVDGGRAPDGSRYQHIVYGGRFDYSVKGMPISFRGWCKAFTWLGRAGGSGGVCEEYGGKPRHDSPIRMVDYRFVQYPRAGNEVAQPDVAIAGNTNRRAASVRVFYTDRNGQERELPVDFARLEGDRLRAAAAKLKRADKRKPAKGKAKPGARKSAGNAGPEPFGVFTAFLPGAAGEAQRIADLAESYLDDPQQPSPLVNGDLSSLHLDGNHCDDREGPFRVVAYDAGGRELPRPKYPGC